MRQRATNESKPVGLFPFLAVLLCTMGALLVLLVVLAQRVGERVLTQQSEPPEASEPLQNDLPEQNVQAADEGEAVALAEQLEEAHAYQEKLRQLREQAEERLQQEQLRLSHIEEHTRRIEHELAHLAIAEKQIEATESDQLVDQQEAKSELVHLRELIKETEEQLEELRKNASGQRSYAIVPYKGPNGTYRRPVYIECSKEGVVIRPEGIRFAVSDFAAPGWPGNPLAAALRASREYLNAKAAKAGEPEPPDPYPLLIVRPDGITQYQLARAALASWDADFGYEFVDRDWKLEYPDLPDPQLAQLQHHAQLNAREQLARLIRSAPSRYHGIGVGGSSSMAAGGTSGGRGYGMGGKSDEPHGFGTFAQSGGGDSSGGDSTDGGLSGDNGSAGGQSFAEAGVPAGEAQHGALGGDSGETGNRSQNLNQANGDGSYAGGDSATLYAGAGNVGARYAGAGSNEKSGGEAGQGDGQNSQAGADTNGLAQAGGQAAGGSSASGNLASGSSGSGSSTGGSAPSGGKPSGQAAAAASLSISNQNVKNIAESRGKNWAISGGARGAVPIRRPIHVVVRKDRLTILPSKHIRGGSDSNGAVISLNQSARQVSDEFAESLRSRVDQWGLAGNGLYWRPVLELNIGPEAEETARGLAKLLRNSGVELSRKDTIMRR